jgi:hypothetical protein
VTTILNPPKFEVGSWVRLLADSEKELHQVELFQIKGKEGWFYQLENKETYAESELEIALDYAEASYEEEF